LFSSNSGGLAQEKLSQTTSFQSSSSSKEFIFISS
jgi:hypothetical protein